MARSPHLTAQEAADTLGITVATLYAYVSRGLLRSTEGDAKKRTKVYAWEDVERLRQRQALKRAPREAVEGALEWGVPTISSAITLIADGRLSYRGQDAIELSRTRSFREVASLLWTGELSTEIFRETRPMPQRARRLLDSLGAMHPTTAMALVLPLLGEDDPAAYDTRPGAAVRTGASVLRTLFESAGSSFYAEGLAEHWGVPQAAHALEAALILCADHELNVSSFTARCVASTGSGLSSCLSAGLGALLGPRHGRSAESALAMLREVGRPDRGSDVVAVRLRRGEAVPGFGHPLYPNGDPRGARLLELSEQLAPASREMEIVRSFQKSALEIMGEYPTIDFGLAALALVLQLKPEAPLTLFALGRSAGWIAHALEEYERGTLIRPRAKYTGKPVHLDS